MQSIHHQQLLFRKVFQGFQSWESKQVYRVPTLRSILQREAACHSDHRKDMYQELGLQFQ